MKRQDLKHASISELLDIYADAAISHGTAMSVGDHKVANKSYDIVAGVYREIRHRGPETQKALLTLIVHNDPLVRRWAASHALEFAPEEGTPILEEIAKSGGLMGLNAEMTLMEWRNGTLEFE